MDGHMGIVPGPSSCPARRKSLVCGRLIMGSAVALLHNMAGPTNHFSCRLWPRAPHERKRRRGRNCPILTRTVLSTNPENLRKIGDLDKKLWAAKNGPRKGPQCAEPIFDPRVLDNARTDLNEIWQPGAVPGSQYPCQKLYRSVVPISRYSTKTSKKAIIHIDTSIHPSIHP